MRCGQPAAAPVEGAVEAAAIAFGSIELVEVQIRRDQGCQKEQRVDDEEQRVADREVSDAGRD